IDEALFSMERETNAEQRRVADHVLHLLEAIWGVGDRCGAACQRIDVGDQRSFCQRSFCLHRIYPLAIAYMVRNRVSRSAFRWQSMHKGAAGSTAKRFPSISLPQS